MASPRICSVEDCGKLHIARGFCYGHLRKWHLYGDPLVSRMPTPHGVPLAWLKQHVTFDGDSCLIWPFCRNDQGYGTLGANGRKWHAHRYMCVLAHGPAPSPSRLALHTCGMGHAGCVHPQHLRWGTHSENESDKVHHKASRPQVCPRRARLTKAQIDHLVALRPALRLCSVDGCGRTTATDYCALHRRRLRRTGTLVPRRTTEPGARLRFLTEVVPKHQSDACLLWPFSLYKGSGYGALFMGNNSRLAHRIVCERFHGKPPTPRHLAAHVCGVRSCVNPRHLVWKTYKENEADKLVHGTHMRGARNHKTKLTEAQVHRIRALQSHMPKSRIAAMFGVSDRTVTFIHRRQNWAWLPEAIAQK